jgi:hypothetical protein
MPVETTLRSSPTARLLYWPMERILGLPSWALCVVFMVILFLRYPQGILHADFWGEDGCLWYADAYDLGWRSVILPHTGYLQTISRVVAMAAQAFPLSWGPTIFAVSAMIIQALPPTLLMSRRMGDAWPEPGGRLCFALIYSALPNSFEVLTNLTNAQWHLAGLAFLIVAIRPSSQRLVAAAELVALALAGLSGPFAIFLLPISVWHFWGSRTDPVFFRPSLFRIGILTACVGIQAALLFDTMSATRLHTPLGAGVAPFARILALQIILGASLGVNLLLRFSRSWIWSINAMPVAISLVGVSLGIVALRQGNRLLRTGAVWATAILTAALMSPVVSLKEPQWPLMALPGVGNRYFLIPMLVWIGILFTLFRDRRFVVRCLSSGFLILMPLGIVTDFTYRRAKPTAFDERAREFEIAPAGTQMTFPVHPPGFQPRMVLTKH